MAQTNCLSLKSEIVKYFGQNIEVSEMSSLCVLTFPNKTIDNRYADVFIEQRTPSYFIVHDGGVTAAQLYAQGIHLTDGRTEALVALAHRYGATFTEGAFRIGCTGDGLQQSIMAVMQCATMGMWFLIGHKPLFTEEPVLGRVERGLAAWHSPYYSSNVRSKIIAKGRKFTHTFDFVCFPEDEKHQPIGVKVLRPSDDSTSKARDYGFLVYDLEKTIFENWLRVVVMTKSDQWTKKAKELVLSLSQSTVEIGTGEEDKIEAQLPLYLNQLAA